MSLRLAKQIAGSAAFLDPASDRIQALARTAIAAAPVPVRNALDGTWLGAPLHPALTDVPVGAWSAGVLLDSVEAFTGSEAAGRAADGALAVGIAGALPAAVAGTNDWTYLRGDSKRLGSVHALLNVSALSLNMLSLLARRRGSRGTGRVLSATGWALGAFSAHLGGLLSFGLGVRVNRTAWESGPDEFEPVLAESELGETELRGVEVGGVPVVLARGGDGSICAIASTCSHLGGPLADGERQGDSVVCPWHGSALRSLLGCRPGRSGRLPSAALRGARPRRTDRAAHRLARTISTAA